MRCWALADDRTQRVEPPISVHHRQLMALRRAGGPPSKAMACASDPFSAVHPAGRDRTGPSSVGARPLGPRSAHDTPEHCVKALRHPWSRGAIRTPTARMTARWETVVVLLPDRGWDLVAATSLAMRRIERRQAFHAAERAGLAELIRTLTDVADLTAQMAVGLASPGYVLASAASETNLKRGDDTEFVAFHHLSPQARAGRVKELAVLAPFVTELHHTLTTWAAMPEDFVAALADEYASAALTGDLTADQLLILSDSLRTTATSVEQFIRQYWT
jgi:hypothetical protein